MKLKLPDGVASSQDLQAVILEIKQYAAWSAKAAIKKRVDAGKAAEPPVMSPAAVALVKDWAGGKPLTQASLDQLITTLEDFEEKASSLTITLAAPPPTSLKTTLVAWCRENIGPDVLVNFQFNSTLLGGMVVRYGSHIFDWSFRRQILAARGRLPEVLRHV